VTAKAAEQASSIAYNSNSILCEAVAVVVAAVVIVVVVVVVVVVTAAAAAAALSVTVSPCALRSKQSRLQQASVCHWLQLTNCSAYRTSREANRS